MTDYFDGVSLDGTGKSIAVLNDTVYAVWSGEPTDSTTNIYFAKSINNGLSFSTDLIVYQGPDSIAHIFPSIAVAQNGNIYITWTAVSNNEKNWNIWFTKSINGGSTFQTPTQITTSNSCLYSCIGAYDDNVYILYTNMANYPCLDYYFVRSINNGLSFESPIQINDAPCTGYVEIDKTSSLTIDASGNIYLAWTDGRRANGNGDIFFAKSTDSGQSFSANVMVNDVSQPGADSVQFMPSIAVEGNNVYVSFTDERLGSDWTNKRVYMAKSIDGGSTFATESFLAGYTGTCKFHDIAVSPSGKLSVAICAHIAPYLGVWLYESTDGGNNFSTPVALCYTFNAGHSDINIVSNSDEEVFALWIDSREGAGINNVYFSKTDLGVNINESNFDNESFIVYPNPTNSLFTVSTPNNVANIEITVCNLQGQIIYKKAHSNTSNVNIDLEIPQGVYFV
ncbi:MAG: T9SS type A sorting domain-containing protein, partial [Bacteroidota bacterium]